MVNEEIIRFPNWDESLFREVQGPDRDAFFDIIDRFLLFCSCSSIPITVSVITDYVEEREVEEPHSKSRLALRWFYRAAKHFASAGSTEAPKSCGAGERPARVLNYPRPRSAADLGQSDWERDLIRAIRMAGFLWRTEGTYRAWATRWVRFIAPRSPYSATSKEVGDFLEQLAVRDRVSFATQKQALNALVFFVKKGLGIKLEEISFRRARASKRVPTVLSREECSRLFNKLTGTSRLMAELMYGSGLRLMELLRLRVHHLDLARGTLQVRAGKGDKDRFTVLPLSLVGRSSLKPAEFKRLKSKLGTGMCAPCWILPRCRHLRAFPARRVFDKVSGSVEKENPLVGR